METLHERKSRFFILSATTFGGIIEWYEIFLFIHWSDLFSKLFFNDDPKLAIYNTLFIFFIGFIGRPVGALVFGDIGDRFGRRIAFISSIALMVAPSFMIGFLGWWFFPGEGLSVAITLCILRFIQGMAAGAELPGAMCYLVECAPKNERTFIASFSFLGPQIGIVLSQLECYIFETQFSQQFIESYGWRISFIIGGVLGLIGILYRSKLEESKYFKLLKSKNLISHSPILEAFKHWKELLIGFFGSLLAVFGFYMFSVFIEIYFHSALNIPQSENLLISICLMTFSTLTLTLIGKIGNNYDIKKLLIYSALGILPLALPLYFSTTLLPIVATTFFLLILLNVQFAILPSFISELFPTSVRYTGIALSFSLCDSLVGGATPWLAGMLTEHIGAVLSFISFISFGALISCIVFAIVNRKLLKMRNI